MELFTVEQLAEISQNPDPVLYDLAGDRVALVTEMKRGGIITKNQIAAFLANICHETDGLKTLEEYGDEEHFRSFLEDEWMYHGRGYIMNTWLDAYQRLSSVLGVDLVSNPDLLAQDKELAAKAAVWYWNMRDCGSVADQGGFVGVCSLINRGENPPQGPINGWEQRLAAYERAKAVIDIGTAEPATEPAKEASESVATVEPEMMNAREGISFFKGLDLMTAMTPMAWVVTGVLAVIMTVTVGSLLGWWDWKVLIGWQTLVAYINPQDATDRKDAVQVYAFIIAGLVATISAAVGLANLRLTRRNLEQQRELEAQRAQGTALQAYYEQMGKLLTEHNLRTTEREEIRLLAQGQTLTVLKELGASRKENVLAFLKGAGLIEAENPAVLLAGADLASADLREVNLPDANLRGANLEGANLRDAYLKGAILRNTNLKNANLEGVNLQSTLLTKANLRGADLRGASLRGANLRNANLEAADLRGADVNYDSLRYTNLRGAIMPDETKHS